VKRFLALGDSYTIGEAVPETSRWPIQLATLLRVHGVEVADPEIVAVTGWTTDELADGIAAARPQGPFDLVSLLIGVNNQYRGLGLEAYRADFAALLRRAVAFAGGRADHVLVLSIPDWSVTPFAADRDRAAIAAAVDRFNEAKRLEALRAGAAWLDITPVSRRAAADASLLADDGLHPSGSMYAEWADMALPHALAALRASGHL